MQCSPGQRPGRHLVQSKKDEKKENLKTIAEEKSQPLQKEAVEKAITESELAERIKLNKEEALKRKKKQEDGEDRDRAAKKVKVPP